MRLSSRIQTFSITIFVLIAIILVLGRSYYATSIDLAWHYTLARNIAQNWAWPDGTFYLAEMHNYPPIAHTMAALVGAALGSTMLGMTTMALLAVAGVYITLLGLMRCKSPGETSLAFLLFCALLLVLRRRHLVFGGEIINNFFYAQMVGTFISFGTFYIISSFWERAPIFQAALTLAVTWLLGWIYPLAQIYLGSAMSCLLFLRAIQEVRLYHRATAPIVISLSILLIGLPLAILKHPTFVIMAKIAQNNGVISGALDQGPEMGMALAVLVVAFVLFVHHLRGKLRLEKPVAFIALAFAVALSSILQWLVFRLGGQGNEYTVAKHSFAVVTLFLSCLVILGAHLLGPFSPKSETRFGSAVQPALVLVTSFVAMLAVFPVGRNLKPLLNDIDFVQHAIDYHLGQDSLGASIVLDPRLNAAEQFAIANGDLQLPKESAIVTYLSSLINVPPEYNSFLKEHPIKYAVVWSELEPKISDTCVLGRGAQASLLLVDYSCVEKYRAVYSVGNWIHVNRLSSPEKFLGTGWSTIETWGVWNDGNDATMTFSVGDSIPASELTLEIRGIGHFAPGQQQQRIKVRANDMPVGEWIVSDAKPSIYELKLSRSAFENGHLQLHFSFPDARPDLQDPRKLAFGLTAFRLRL